MPIEILVPCAAASLFFAKVYAPEGDTMNIWWLAAFALFTVMTIKALADLT